MSSLVYIEYRSRREGVDLQLFHRFSASHGKWSEENPQDRMIINIGRTWRVGPRQDYIVAFHCPNSGLERIDEWEQVFTSGDADDLILKSQLTNRIDVAGCYEPLLEPVQGKNGPYYVEFFDIARRSDANEVRALFDRRTRQHGELRLHLLVDRIGKLGPDPRGLAVWSGPSYRSFTDVALDLDTVEQPVNLVSCGFYNDVGAEIL